MPANLKFEVPKYTVAEAEEFLRRYEPWRMQITFECGVSSDQFETFEPFNRHPLFKLEQVVSEIDEALLGGRILDVGANQGHNSLFLASEHGAKVTAIDNDPKHKAATDELAAKLGLSIDYRLEDAQTFCVPLHYDIVLNLGVLYHLPNPLDALAASARSVAPGGVLVIETVENISDNPHERASIRHIPGDNHWAIGPGEIKDVVSEEGLSGLTKVRDGRPPQYEGKYSRPIYIARRSL